MSLTNLHGYEPFAPPRPIDFDSWSQREARSYFEWFVDQIPERIDQLRKLVEKTDGACRPWWMVYVGDLEVVHARLRAVVVMDDIDPAKRRADASAGPFLVPSDPHHRRSI